MSQHETLGEIAALNARAHAEMEHRQNRRELEQHRGHGTLVDDNGNVLGRITNLSIEGITLTAAHDHLADTFPEELGARVSVVDLPLGGKMVSGSANELRAYICRDIEATEKMRKQIETEQTITEALHMQARGRAAPLPRPTMIAMCIRAVCDDLESWSKP